MRWKLFKEKNEKTSSPCKGIAAFSLLYYYPFGGGLVVIFCNWCITTSTAYL